jgi:hypothetical protein
MLFDFIKGSENWRTQFSEMQHLRCVQVCNEACHNCIMLGSCLRNILDGFTLYDSQFSYWLYIILISCHVSIKLALVCS